MEYIESNCPFPTGGKSKFRHSIEESLAREDSPSKPPKAFEELIEAIDKAIGTRDFGKAAAFFDEEDLEGELVLQTHSPSKRLAYFLSFNGSIRKVKCTNVKAVSDPMSLDEVPADVEWLLGDEGL